MCRAPTIAIHPFLTDQLIRWHNNEQLFLGSHKIAHFACANFFIAYIRVMITPLFKVNVWWSRWRRKLGCTILLRWGATQIVTQIGFDEWASSCDDETTPLSCYSSALQCAELILVFTFSHVKSEIQEKVGVYLQFSLYRTTCFPQCGKMLII